MTEDERKQLLSKIVYTEKIVSEFKPMSDEYIASLDKPKTDKYEYCGAECPECHKKEVTWRSQQTRAGDEAETIFYKCTCGHNWRHEDC